MIRVAVIGYGIAGSAFHAPFLERSDDFGVAAVVTRDPERRALAARRHPAARLLDDATEAIDRDACDLVVVATPNRFHLPLALAAVEAGLPVVVDKPVAPTAAGVRELLDAGGLVVPFHNRRWDGDFLTVRELVAGGRLGRVHRFESRFERFKPVVQDVWRERADPAEGAGVLLDLGTHLVDQALQLLGPPVEVHGEADVRREGGRAVDDAFIALRHEGGAVSHLYASAVAAHQGPRFRVLGDEGALVKHGLDPQEPVLRGGDLSGPVAAEPDAELHRAGAVEPVPVAPGDYGAFYRGLAATLRDGAPPPVALTDALAVAAVLDEVVRPRSG